MGIVSGIDVTSTTEADATGLIRPRGMTYRGVISPPSLCEVLSLFARKNDEMLEHT